MKNLLGIKTKKIIKSVKQTGKAFKNSWKNPEFKNNVLSLGQQAGEGIKGILRRKLPGKLQGLVKHIRTPIINVSKGK